MIALLDSDVMAYRAAAACKEEGVTAALFTVDSIVVDALLHCDDGEVFYDKWKLFLTGSNNFRKQIATTVPYKGNRTAPKPEHLPAVREHLVKQWGAVITEGQEADDAIAIEATTNVGACVIISIDKDFRQVPGHHYNFVKREHFYVTPESGLRFLYMQILMGDTADNIIGISGVGPKRAEALLEGYTEEMDMYNACVEAYDGNEDRVIENAQLLYLRRKENELWLPPNKRHLATSLPKKASRSRKNSVANTTPTSRDTDS
jgi:hypothetical protein